MLSGVKAESGSELKKTFSDYFSACIFLRAISVFFV